MQRLQASQVFVEDDMVVFGYGGFYERPKGWGLDVCYFHKREFAWWRSRGRLFRRIRKAFDSDVKSGQLMEGFVPQFIQRLKRHITHEWHYDRADLMFQSAKTVTPSLARYTDFPSFVKMVISGQPFCTPQELELRVRQYLLTVLSDDEPLQRVESQTYLLFGFLLKAIETDMTELLGVQQGEWLFQQLVAAAPTPPRKAESLEEFMTLLFENRKALAMLANWHGSYFTQLLDQPKKIRKTLRKLRVAKPKDAPIAKARKAVLREAKSALPPELPALLARLRIPLFIATGADLTFFRDFHQPGYLVYKQTGEMHQMTGMGLCAHRPYAKGGIFVTYSRENPARFSHTLMEECTHFADGPQDRVHMQGAARYSGTAEFHAAFEADYRAHAPWQNSKALGQREWGVILTQMRYGARRIARLQKRIDAFSATLDFRHYAEAERMAEVFAALPVIERAVGRKTAQAVLPQLMAYYASTYRAGLRQEIRGK